MSSEKLARLEACQESTRDMVKELHEHLIGKPGTDGLVTRMSKVEQKQSIFMRIAATIGTAVVGVCVWLVKGKV